MILFVLITTLAGAETLLILTGAIGWLRARKLERSDRGDHGDHEALNPAALPEDLSSPAAQRHLPNGKASSRCLARSRLECAEGCLLGLALGLITIQLGFELLLHTDDLMAYFGGAGLLLGLFGVRKVLRAVVALGCTVLMFIIYTPVSAALIKSLERADVVRPAPAIVVLLNTLYPDGTMSAAAQSRALKAYTLLRAGMAPLVLTARFRSEGSLASAMRTQMNDLGLAYQVEESGIGDNTHDEAVLAARVARERHWDSVILVTHPWHMRRAAATFEKAGLHVQCAPCSERDYDNRSVGMTHERLAAFRDWLHEVIGYETYRVRGWL